MSKILKIGVLISGRGSNLKAIIAAAKKRSINAKVCVVVSDKKSAGGLKIARQNGIPAFVVERKNFPDTIQFETKIKNILRRHGVSLVCLAGFMRIIGKTLLGGFKNRIINIHPALLPSFPGLGAQAQALAHGVKVAGCTVHFVDEKVDHGPIICQKAVLVKENDTIESLSAHILKEEHKLYPKAIGLIANNRVKLRGKKIQGDYI